MNNVNRPLLWPLALLTLIALAGPPVRAQNLSFGSPLSFQSQLTRDDQVQLFTFSLDAFSLVSVRTWSYAGGVNANGVPIARGGFDPVLSLFHGSGLLLARDDDNDFGLGYVLPDRVTGNAWDAYLEIELDPGSYTVAISQYDNVALGPSLSDGFARAGEGNFTGGPFLDREGNPRSGRFALDITVIPEPGTGVLLLPALLPLAGIFLRRRSRA